MPEISYIQITRECNSHCIICSNPPTGYQLTFAAAKKTVDALAAQKCKEVILTGGEPTLYPQLPGLIKYCLAKKVSPRIITNGQKIADKAYLLSLKKAGLQHLHLSIYSCQDAIQAKITGNKNALANIKRSLGNLSELGGITTDINIVINRYNADHLSEIVVWLVKRYGFIRHFVFNNLDPLMNRVSDHPDVIPRLNDFELELHEALVFLTSHQKTFRVERVPLCYLTDFEHVSTETRKIVKQEQRVIYFLDQRRRVLQDDWFYARGNCCTFCSLNKICAGLSAAGKGFSEDELYPVFIDPEDIVRRIRETS